MMAFLASVVYGVAVVILLGVSIFVHELGHFLAALWTGMAVDTFSIGFGPSIWKKKVRGVTYKIGWIPFGGYVALPQLDPAGMAVIQGQEKDGHTTTSRLPQVSPWAKILVVVAGPIGNILLAIGLAWVVYFAPRPPASDDEGKPIVGVVEADSEAARQGIVAGDEIVAANNKPVNSWYQLAVECTLTRGHRTDIDLILRARDGLERTVTVPLVEEDEVWRVPGIERTTRCGVANLVPGSPAEQAGVQVKDIIYRVDGEPVLGVNHFIKIISSRGGQETVLLVEREGKTQEIRVTPAFDSVNNRAMIGAAISPVLGPGESPWLRHRKPLAQLREDATAIVRILQALITPSEARQAAGALGGPVMIIMALVVSIKTSLLNAVGFLRFLNVNLAILNLLPIPVLDGGHVVFAAWEGITRRKVPPRLVNALTNFFAVLLVGVVLIITYKDIRERLPRFFARSREKEAVLSEPAGKDTAAVSTNVPSPAAGGESGKDAKTE